MVGAPPRLRDQRHMAGMERAHGRHEGDRAAVRRASAATAARSASMSRMICTALGPPIEAGRRAPCGSRTAIDQVSRSRRCAVPHFIVFANEKGGTGKSTTAVHSAVALAAAGRAGWRRSTSTPASARSAAISTTAPRRCSGSASTCRCRPTRRSIPAKGESLDERSSTRIGGDAEIVVIDTPGRDDPHARAAMVRADTLVTPINDSFVDLDLIGEVDAETYRVRRPSFYAELVWNSRTQRAKTHGASVDWVVLRNRMQHIEARNMRRVGEALDELSRRVGFRVIPGLGERVIYRELFPKGLTLLDLHEIGEVGHRPYRRAPGIARDDRRLRPARAGRRASRGAAARRRWRG